MRIDIIKLTSHLATVCWLVSSCIDTHDTHQTRPLFSEQHLHLSLCWRWSLIAKYVLVKLSDQIKWTRFSGTVSNIEFHLFWR